MCCILVGVLFWFFLVDVGGWLTCAVPYESRWLTGVGLAFFFLNICLFIMNCTLICLRFYWRPSSLIDSFTDQFESLFISAIVSLFVCQPLFCVELTLARSSRKQPLGKQPTHHSPP